jgi:peroxiredoxin
MVNALVNFLWLGGLIFLAGGALALWPQNLASPWNIIAGVLVFGSLVGAGWTMWGLPHGAVVYETGRPLIGQPAPDFRLPLVTSEGQEVITLADLEGQVALINFWAPWCPTCKDDLPMLESVWSAYADRGVVMLGAAFDTTTEAVVESIDLYGMTYPVGLDTGERMADAYGITGVPETFVIDGEGRIAYIHVGGVSEEQLTSELDTLLGRQ